ncbi:hypothetical protein EDB19DRAFT_1832434 [Suillus lakei]|nr:hypothetical protein EDB19DRAFT_1832434 [Suillus lakei]
MIWASGPWAKGRNILDYDGWAASGPMWGICRVDEWADGHQYSIDGWAEVVGYYVDRCTKVDVYQINRQKFNAEKTGGDPVIPSPKLDTDLVMACDRLVDQLIKAYKNPIQTQIDIARYSKLISPKDMGHNEEREEKLLERCPPGHEGTKLVEIPTTILDASGAIIAWYLPGCPDRCHPDQMVPTEGNLGGLRFARSNARKKCKG